MTRIVLAGLGVAIGVPFGILLAAPVPLAPQVPSRDDAMRAAIHPVADDRTMRSWLARVPLTSDYPADFADTLREAARVYTVEMSTAPGCLPCADLWTRLDELHSRYGWRVRTIPQDTAMLRSGRLGLPWVGHPVAWVRGAGDDSRAIPIAIGTDLAPNLARNVYLAAKMLEGVRPAVGVRAMAKFTGIIGARQAFAADRAFIAHQRSNGGPILRKGSQSIGPARPYRQSE
jgi:hypothetical protein